MLRHVPLARLSLENHLQLAEYEQHCNNFLIEKAIKDAIRQSAEAERQRAVDTAMQETDQLPVEQSVSELINDGIKKQNANMLKEITQLKNLVRQLTNSQQSGNTTIKEDKSKEKRKVHNLPNKEAVADKTKNSERRQKKAPNITLNVLQQSHSESASAAKKDKTDAPSATLQGNSTRGRVRGRNHGRGRGRGRGRDKRITNLAIHNLSSRVLSYYERKVLGLGLNFIPRPLSMNVDSILKEYRNFARMLRLRCYFGPEDEEKRINPFRVTNPYWRPPEAYSPLEDIIRFGEDTLREQIAKNPPLDKPSLPVKLGRALQSIRKDDSIIIKPADKNLGLVVMDKSWYFKEVDSFGDLFPGSTDYLLTNPPSKAKLCAFHLLPKIHKPVVVGRPICNYQGYMLEPASKFLHYILLPILLKQQNHLPDSITLLNLISKTQFASNVILFTFDVESLYPSISTKEGLAALREMVEDVSKEGSFSNRYIDMIMHLAELILTEHCLEFNNVCYKQIQGTAMGSNFAVVYACLFLYHLERKVAEKICLKNLNFFKRYIDDAFGVWSGTIEELEVYFRTYSKIYPNNIKITTLVSVSAVNILDIKFYKDVDFVETGILATRCYQKELNAYQYILFSSWHPHHQKESFIVSELRRFLHAPQADLLTLAL
eukprot:Gb_11119 [translate_table: standard]